MRRPSQGLRDESIAAKWEEVRQWEEGEAREQVAPTEGAGREAGQARTKLQQLRKSSSKRFASIKTQLSGMVKGGKESKSGGGEVRPGGVSTAPGGVSTAPGGEEAQQAGCGPLQSLGGRLKASKSLQNLEQATKDSMRAVVDKTSYTASNMKHRYGSRLELSGKLTGKYDKFQDDADSSDEENCRPY